MSEYAQSFKNGGSGRRSSDAIKLSCRKYRLCKKLKEEKGENVRKQLTGEIEGINRKRKHVPASDPMEDNYKVFLCVTTEKMKKKLIDCDAVAFNYSKEKTCELCGAEGDTKMFQVCNPNTLKSKNEWGRKMKQMYRKTLAVCTMCSKKIHNEH